MQLSSHSYLYERSSSTASSIPSTMAPNNSGSNTIHTSYFSLHFVITYFVTAAAARSCCIYVVHIFIPCDLAYFLLSKIIEFSYKEKSPNNGLFSFFQELEFLDFNTGDPCFFYLVSNVFVIDTRKQNMVKYVLFFLCKL